MFWVALTESFDKGYSYGLNCTYTDVHLSICTRVNKHSEREHIIPLYNTFWMCFLDHCSKIARKKNPALSLYYLQHCEVLQDTSCKHKGPWTLCSASTHWFGDC